MKIGTSGDLMFWRKILSDLGTACGIDRPDSRHHGLIKHPPDHVHSRVASTAPTATTTVAKDGIRAPVCVWPAFEERAPC